MRPIDGGQSIVTVAVSAATAAAAVDSSVGFFLASEANVLPRAVAAARDPDGIAVVPRPR